MNKIFHPLHPLKSDDARKIINDRLILIFFIFILYLLLTLFDVGCPIKYLTGISCPGCGMTRALRSALFFDFEAAFHYHPLFLLSPIIVFLFLFEPYINPKYNKLAWSIIIPTFIIIYFFRLFITNSEVVEIDISSGLVVKLLHQLGVGGYK
ncbi:MAG: putative rane protein [Herbinix sp.]|jgi:hypothetical protein|nr:putative rane protein [Herbinix sp.]